MIPNAKNDCSDRTTSAFRRIIDCLFIIVFSWICFIVFWSGQRKYSVVFLIITCSLTALFFLIRERIRALIFRLSYKKCIIAGAVLSFLGMAVMLITAFSVKNDVNDNWDYGMVFSTGAKLAAGRNTLSPIELDYSAMYGNNALFLGILSRILKLIVLITGNKDVYFLLDCSIVLNCIFILTAILVFSYCTTALRSVQQGLLAQIILLLMSPFYLYAAFTYTSVYGFLPPAFTLFFIVKALLRKHMARQYVYLCFAAVSSSFGFMIKGTVIIYLLTAFATILFAREFCGNRLRCLIVYTVAAALSIICITHVNHSFLNEIGVSSEMRAEKEFPASHFLMMSMNPKNVGQYDNVDVEYTKSFSGKSAKKEADTNELKRRLAEMGFGGFLNHIFIKKAKYIYGTGTAAAPNYITRKPLNNTKMVDFLGSNSGFFETTLIYKAVLEGFILIMSVLLLIKHKDDDGYILFMKICLIGMFLFFCMWEAHARYTFIFLPIISLLTAEYIIGIG